MAINSDDDTEDQDDFGLIEDDDDGTDEIIRKALAEFDGGGDTEVFSGQMKAEESAIVSQEQGLDLLDKATNKRGLNRINDASGVDDGAAAKPEADAAAVDAVDTKAPAEPDEIDTLLTGLDDGRRSQIRDRITSADNLMAVFKGRDAELQMHGTTPDQVIRRLIQLNEYATAKPEEYLAWAATQINPEKAEDILISAAGKLGLKLVREDDDPFEDDAVKNLRAENRQLKAKARDLGFGPDAEGQQPTAQPAANPVMDTIAGFIGEKNQDGTPKRPHWDRLKGDVVTRAAAHREATGKFVTPQDLDQFYQESEAAARAAFGAPQPAPSAPAAQAKPAVSGVASIAASPDRLARAKAASTSIDGAGQGAGRRPALAADATLEQVIRHAAGYSD